MKVLRWAAVLVLVIGLVGVISSPGDTAVVSCGTAIGEFLSGPALDIPRRTDGDNLCFDPAVARLQLSGALIGGGLVVLAGIEMLRRGMIRSTLWRTDPNHDSTYEYVDDLR